MQFQPVEVEFDIAADKESFITDFKDALANWKPSDEPALATYLSAQQPDGAVSTELTFCEAYNSGAAEFQVASDSIKTLGGDRGAHPSCEGGGIESRRSYQELVLELVENLQKGSC